MVKIRAARDEDAVAVADLLTQLGYPADSAVVPARLERMRREAGQHTLVAELDGRVVGMATVIVRHVINDDAPFARLASIVVADGHRGHGIGQALVGRAEEIASEAGCTVIEVTSGEHRPRAHRLYRGLGYEERPRRFIKRL